MISRKPVISGQLAVNRRREARQARTWAFKPADEAPASTTVAPDAAPTRPLAHYESALARIHVEQAEKPAAKASPTGAESFMAQNGLIARPVVPAVTAAAGQGKRVGHVVAPAPRPRSPGPAAVGLPVQHAAAPRVAVPIIQHAQPKAIAPLPPAPPPVGTPSLPGQAGIHRSATLVAAPAKIQGPILHNEPPPVSAPRGPIAPQVTQSAVVTAGQVAAVPAPKRVVEHVVPTIKAGPVIAPRVPVRVESPVTQHPSFRLPR